MKRVSIFFVAGLLLATGCASFSEPTGDALRDSMGISLPELDLAAEDTPVSYSAEVILAQAEGHYRERQFADSAAEYARFMTLHATHPWAPFALFREGMSYAHQSKSNDRAPKLMRQASAAFERLLSQYSGSPADAAARTQRGLIRERLADHERGIARFYLRTKRPEAALGRLRGLMADYGDTAVAKTGWLELGQALMATDAPNEALEAFRNYLKSGATDTRRLRIADDAITALGGG